MSTTLTFQKIVNGTIFKGQFNAMTVNNTISFDRPIAVVWYRQDFFAKSFSAW